MKSIIDKIGVIFAVAFALLLLIAVSPVILFFLILYGTPELYAYIWSKLRKDPSSKIFIDELNNNDFDSAHTIKQFEDAFDKLTVELGVLTKAEVKDIVRTGYGNLENVIISNWQSLTLSRILVGGAMKAEISFVYGVHSKVNDKFQASMENGDDQLSAMPPFTATVFKNDEILLPNLVVGSVQAAIFFVAIMRNNFTHNPVTKQLWAYSDEYGVWLVKYRDTKSDYGMRHEYSAQRARRFWFDDK